MLALQSEKKLDFRAGGPRVARSQRRPFRSPLVWSRLLALLVVGYHCACVLWCESEREGVGIAPLRSCAPAYPQGASWRIRTPWNVPGTYQVVLGNSQELHGAGRDPWDAPGSSRRRPSTERPGMSQGHICSSWGIPRSFRELVEIPGMLQEAL